MELVAVINATASPIAVHAVTHTALPVRITNFPTTAPDPIALRTLWYAEATFWAAVGTAILTIGGIAVALIDYWLNRSQATKADIERSKQPKLMVTLQFLRPPGPLNSEERFRTRIEVFVANYGSAPANNIELTLAFPADDVEQTTQDEMDTNSGRIPVEGSHRAIELSPSADSFGNRWAVVFDRHLEILPGQRLMSLGEGWFHVRPTTTSVYWRIKCRQGHFPPSTVNNLHPDSVLPVTFG